MAIECNPQITDSFQGYLSEDWMFYCDAEEISLYDYNPTTERLEFVGVCGKFVFLKTLHQQRIAIAIKDIDRPLLFIFRELDPLCTVEIETYTITFHNNGSLFAIVFNDDEVCKRCYEVIERQVIKHFNKLVKRTKMTEEEARNKTIEINEVIDNSMRFGNDEEKIKHYLNCSLPYFQLPHPFSIIGLPQTSDMNTPLKIPKGKVENRHDEKDNQRKGMGINPPVVTINVMQKVHNGEYDGDYEYTDSDDDNDMEEKENDTPRKTKQPKKKRQASDTTEFKMEDLNQMNAPRRRMQTNERPRTMSKTDRMASTSNLQLQKDQSGKLKDDKKSKDFP